MPTLVDILEQASSRPEIEGLVLDTSIIAKLQHISDVLDYSLPQMHIRRRTSAHIIALESFIKGLNDGYGGNKKSDKFVLYQIGHDVGAYASAQINNRDAESTVRAGYERLVSQWRTIVPVLQEEVRLRRQIYDNPYEFLIKEIERDILGFPQIAEGLVMLLSRYETLVKNLLRDGLEGDFVKDLESIKEPSPYAHAQLGIVHMLKGELSIAQSDLTKALAGARELGDAELVTSLEHAAPSVLKAYNILKPIYSMVQSADNFEAIYVPPPSFREAISAIVVQAKRLIGLSRA